VLRWCWFEVVSISHVDAKCGGYKTDGLSLCLYRVLFVYKSVFGDED
jgi:hypothetical protein